MPNFRRPKTTQPASANALATELKSRPGEMFIGPNFLATYSEGLGAVFACPVDHPSNYSNEQLEQQLVSEFEKFINDPTIQK